MEDRTGYLGFTYNGIHSSAFNIVRTSDGSRFNQNLLPTIQDKTIQIPGAPGRIFQRADYDTRVFSIQIAYDEMGEQNMQEMRRWLGDKKIHPLIFDELPYKTWYAKVTGTASMKWIPFSEGQTNRTYKGEGTIQFTCYDPFAHCSCRWLDRQIQEKKIELDANNRPIDPEVLEWWDSSGFGLSYGQNMYSSLEVNENNNLETGLETNSSSNDLLYAFVVDNNGYLSINETSNLALEHGGFLANLVFKGVFGTYNCGDIDTDFKLRLDCFPKQVDDKTKYYLPAGGIYLGVNNQGVSEIIGGFHWQEINLEDGDQYILINTKMNLVEGLDANCQKTGKIYDQYKDRGDYFKLPVGQSSLWLKFDDSTEPLSELSSELDFDYLYF